MKELSKQQMQKVEDRVLSLTGRANSFVVKTTDDVEAASEFLKKIKDAGRKIEDKRLEFTGPLNQSLKAINTTFKKLREPLEQAKRVLSDKILSWRRIENERARKAEEVRRKEEEEKIRKIMEARKAEVSAEKKQEMIEEIIEEDEQKPVIEKPKGTIGKARTRKVWTFKVEDFSQVPDKYKLLNQVEVNEDIRAGVRKIDGLKIYQKELLTIV